MNIVGQRCLSLGITQKEAGEFNGKPTPAYTALDFVVVDEKQSRRAYLTDAGLISTAFQHCARWGCMFTISGSVDSKGKLTIEKIESAENAEELAFL